MSVYPSLDKHIREGNGTPLQYSSLENPLDGGAWWAAVHGVTKSRTQLSDLTFTFHFHSLEKEMATHSSVLAWRIPEMGEPGGLLSMGSHRVGHDWSDLAYGAYHFSKKVLESPEKRKGYRIPACCYSFMRRMTIKTHVSHKFKIILIKTFVS